MCVDSTIYLIKKFLKGNYTLLISKQWNKDIDIVTTESFSA
jgi:hypothetical protein